MEEYNEYKDSGVEWFESIPNHWRNSKLKYAGKLICGGTPSTSNKDYWDGDIPWMQSGKVHFKHITLEDIDKFISKDALNESSTKMVRKNSTVLAITGATCSNIGFLTFDSTVNQSVIGIENNENYLSLYLYYYMISQKKQILFHQSGGAQGGVTKQEVENLHIPKLPLKEQEQIVAFLDDKTEKIDDLLAKTKKKIELLKEKRTALINHCVTKGLNPNTPMKDSGVEWFESIPNHWRNSKLKYAGKLICGGTPSTSNKDYWDGDIPWMQSGKVHFKHITLEDIDKFISKDALNESSTKMVRKNSTVLAITGATCSNIGFLTFDSTVNQSVIGIENNENYLSLYLYYYMISQKKQILFHQSGGAQGGVTKQEVENLHIPKLPLKEQEQIVAFLDDKTEKIDDLLAKTKKKIELLKEYRQSLISNVVTGKIKVCN